jgi:hypothetical protein
MKWLKSVSQCFFQKQSDADPIVSFEYPSPEGFAKEYSVGVGSRWLLDLGNISERLTAIASAERREYLEIPM